MNLGDEYQNFLISMALLIVGDEGWTTNLWQFPSDLSPATKLVDGTHNTFYFLRYAHVRYVKRLFTNIQKQ